MEKPEGLLETDSEESLQAVVTGSKETCGRLQEEKGRLEQQIEADDRRAAERQEKEAELESLRAERDELSSNRKGTCLPAVWTQAGDSAVRERGGRGRRSGSMARSSVPRFGDAGRSGCNFHPQ